MGWLRGKLFEIDTHKHCSYCGSGSCTICNFVGKFLTVKVGGKERCTDWYT